MKKLLIPCMLLMTSYAAVSAQETKSSFEVMAGVHMADWHNGYGDPIVGVRGGIGLQHRFNDKWALDLGVLYTMSGTEVKAGNTQAVVRTDFIHLPILAEFYIANTGFNINVGPQIGFRLNSDVSYKSGAPAADQPEAKYVPTTYGMVGGFGYDFDCGVMMDLQFNHDFTRLLRSEYNGYRGDVFPYGVSFMVGYRF